MILRPTGMPVGRIFASRGAAAGCRRQQKGGIAAEKCRGAAEMLRKQQRYSRRGRRKARRACCPEWGKLSMNMESSKGGFAAEKCREAAELLRSNKKSDAKGGERI